MRLAVNHPDLVALKMKANVEEEKSNLVCGICHELAEDAIVAKCTHHYILILPLGKHIFCREDVRQ